MSVEKFISRKSVRDFDKKPLNVQDLEIIKQVINNAPTSTNSQQFSAIIVTDPEIKDFIATNNWNQQHIRDSAAFIVFVADVTGTDLIAKEKHLNTLDEVKHYNFYRAIIDATIASTYCHDALLMLNYGVTMVGGIHGFGDELAKKLNLPSSAFVVNGLSFGKATRENAVKPKIDKVFVNQYDAKARAANTLKYQTETADYFKGIIKKDYFDEQAMYAANPMFVKCGVWLTDKSKNFSK